MRDCLVLGSGRSGTSLTAGCLANAGYFMGTRLLPPSPTNPKGFFESQDINDINEERLATVVARRVPFFGRWFLLDRPVYPQRWLARVPLEARLRSSRVVDAAIRAFSAKRPFCFKDPRFCYTLPAWRPHIGDVALVCVFRDPTETAASILREKEGSFYLRRLRIDVGAALEVWTLMYEHVLREFLRGGDWLFLHYDQLLEGSGLRRLAEFLGVAPDGSFVDKALRRSSRTEVAISGRTSAVYRRLCELASFRPGSL